MASAVAAVLLAACVALAASGLASAAYGEDSSSQASSAASADSRGSAPSSPSRSAASASDGASASDQAATHRDAPVAADPFADACAVDMDDALYLIDVKLEGGSGRGSVSSPAEFEVFDGHGVVTLVWSSSNYDYMVVGGKRYNPVNVGGDSTFVVPVTALDTPVEIIADTTAMSEPHEVEYTITFDSASIKMLDEQNQPAAGVRDPAPAQQQPAPAASTTGLSIPWIIFIVCAVLSAAIIGVTIGILRGYRNR